MSRPRPSPFWATLSAAAVGVAAYFAVTRGLFAFLLRDDGYLVARAVAGLAPLGFAIYRAARPLGRPWAFGLATAFALGAWRGLVVVAHGDHAIDLAGWCLAYPVGLVWCTYLSECAAQRIEARRGTTDLSGRPLIPVAGDPRDDRRGGWNPLDPTARFYGRSDRRLRQSLAMLMAYSVLFLLVYVLTHLSFGPTEENIYELPAGGGSDSIKASSVKVTKVVRKKYVINPFSQITFAAPPPIDKIELKLDQETSNQYKAGNGPGGLGEGEGDGGGFGGGTGRGKIRFIRLRHSDKAWDKNFGINGDRNLLAELVVREPKLQGKVADETEAMDIATLGTFPDKKSPPLVYIGGAHTFAPSAADKQVLKKYLTERHGMILGDNLGGPGFHNNFIAVMNEITGVAPVPIPRDDRIHERPYTLPQLPIVVAHGGSTPLGWKIDGRWAVYYHPGALSDAWRDDRAGIKKEIAELCYQLGINIIQYAHREYSLWLKSQQ